MLPANAPASRLLAGLLLFLVAARLDADPVKYQIIDLGAPAGGAGSIARSINSAGDIAGQVDMPTYTTSYIWRFSTGKMSTFNPDIGHGSDQAYGINDADQVTGNYPYQVANQLFRNRVYVYDGGTDTVSIVDLGLTPVDDAFVNGINNSGQVVGDYFENDDTETGYIVTPGSPKVDLGTLQLGGISVGTCINDLGHVGGNASVGASDFAFIWISGSMTKLAFPAGASQTYAEGINDSDQIVGTMQLSGTFVAMLYTNGTMTSLGVNGGTSADAHAINSSGRIVGDYHTTGNIERAFVYASGTFSDLNDLIAPGQADGFTKLTSGFGINNNGWICGFGDTAQHGQRSYLAIPAGSLVQGAPVVVTGTADGLVAASGTLHGSVVPNNLSTTAWFDYGTTTKYSSKTTAQIIGSGTNPIDFAGQAMKLKPHTLYHYRGTAKNSSAQVSGSDAIFTTADTPPLAVNDIFLSNSAKPGTISILSNDTDADHDKLTAGNLTPGTSGSATFKGSAVVYAPGTGFTGIDSFTYTAGDAFGAPLSTGTVFILNKSFDGLAVLSSGSAVSGYAEATLTVKHGVSAEVNLSGTVYRAVGAFDSSDNFQKVISPRGLAPLTVNFHLDLPHAQITGSLNNGQAYTVTMENDVTIWPGGAHAYSAMIPPPADPTLPQGTGFGTMNVTAAGAVSLAGKLGDGAAYTTGAHLHADNTWFLYLPIPYAKKSPGLIGGTVLFASETDSDCSGVLNWTRPPVPGAFYSMGFTTDVTLRAGLFTPPLKNQQILLFSNTTSGLAAFSLTGGDLPAPITHNLAVSTKNGVTVTDPSATDKLALKVTPSTGRITGSFVHPLRPLGKTSIDGVIYQKTNLGGVGLFSGTATTGAAILAPQ